MQRSCLFFDFDLTSSPYLFMPCHGRTSSVKSLAYNENGRTLAVMESEKGPFSHAAEALGSMNILTSGGIHFDSNVRSP